MNSGLPESQKQSQQSCQRSDSADDRWIFVVHALNRPGTLTDAAAVFSNRGVSLENFLGSGIDTNSVEDGRLLLSFRATQEKKDLLKRSLQRLPSVLKVREYAFSDERLRLVAVVKLSLDAQTDVADLLYVETISCDKTTRLQLMTGRATVVESAIAHLREQAQLKDVVVSAITV